MDPDTSVERRSALEWPTLALIAAIYAAWLALTWFHAALPVWAWLAAATWLSAWWGSVQHEAMHGHPTRSRAVNSALATPPFALWLPFERYRQTHLAHHNDERLTDPLDDPESRYWTADGWQQLGSVGQQLVALQATLAGRVIIGPLWSIWRFWVDDTRRLIANERGIRGVWAWHVVWCALVLGWVSGICGVPLWLYVAGFVYGGTAITLVRSFAEHLATDAVHQRTAIVEQSPVLGLLYLHNNLHVVHHRWPSIPWYRLPGVYRANRSAMIALNGGLVYAGYGDVARRYLLRAYDTPVHPQDRVTKPTQHYAGTE